MISSVTQVYQLALDMVGTRSNISSPTEASREAEVCNRWYETVRDHVFRTAFWPSIKKVERLALLAERGSEDWVASDPAPGWTYAYSVPADMVGARFLSTYSRFELSWQGAQVAVQTNQEDAILFYSFRQTNPGAWDVGLQMAVVSALAAHIALPLTGKPNRAELILKNANDLILQARVATANEAQNSHDSIPEWIEARGYGDLAPHTRYIMPYAPLLTTVAGASNV